MIYRGKVCDGVIVLDNADLLPEGAEVKVELLPEDPGGSGNGLLRMLDFVGDAGPTDLSTNIDHYLYGHPKVEDGH